MEISSPFFPGRQKCLLYDLILNKFNIYFFVYVNFLFLIGLNALYTSLYHDILQRTMTLMSFPPGTCENYNSVRHPFIMNCLPSFYSSTVYLTETYPGMDHTEVLTECVLSNYPLCSSVCIPC